MCRASPCSAWCGSKHAHELIVGASVDPVFGPVILFGQGGTAVEVLADRALALPPLNMPLALAQIARTRVAKLLRGYRDEPAADVQSVAQVLVAVSQLLADLPELAELDINPLLVNHEGAVALDARVRVSARRPAGAAHFAIQPYPQHLVESWAWQGEAITLRPIRPEDEPQHRRFLEQIDPEDIRLRVFYSRRTIEHSELARLTQIDYAREMAFIATRPTADDGEETLGTVRATVDPDNLSAEFGVIVRSDLKGSGLGHRLMTKIIEHLRERGTQRLVGTVLRENTGMLELARGLGFQESADPGDPDDRGTRFVSLQPPERRLTPSALWHSHRSPPCPHPQPHPRNAARCCCAAPACWPPPPPPPGSPRLWRRAHRCGPRPARAKARSTRSPCQPTPTSTCCATATSRYTQGVAAWVEGTVTDTRGVPVSGAVVEIWQCDQAGHYHHPGDGGKADPAFQGFGRVAVGKDGSYRFRTLRPARYGGRTPHIHVKVKLDGADLLTTQLYVADDPGNARDFLWRRLDARGPGRAHGAVCPGYRRRAGALPGGGAGLSG